MADKVGDEVLDITAEVSGGKSVIDSKKVTKKRKASELKRDKDSSDDESVGSLKDFIVKDVEALPKVSEEEEEKLAREEAEKLVQNLKADQTTKYSLRDRTTLKPVVDPYMERFGNTEARRLHEEDEKRDIIKFVKELEAEFKESYVAAGHAWPVLKIKMSLDAIRAFYQPLKEFAGLPDSDDESGIEEDESDEDEDESDDETDNSEDESEDEDEDEDEEDGEI
jgi:hypothetical protein